jgi:hypothetical protein
MLQVSPTVLFQVTLNLLPRGTYTEILFTLQPRQEINSQTRDFPTMDQLCEQCSAIEFKKRCYSEQRYEEILLGAARDILLRSTSCAFCRLLVRNFEKTFISNADKEECESSRKWEILARDRPEVTV